MGRNHKAPTFGPRQGERGRGRATFERLAGEIAAALADPDIADEVRRALEASHGDLANLSEAGVWRFAERLIAERNREIKADAARERVRDAVRTMSREELQREAGTAMDPRFAAARTELLKMERVLSVDERRLRTLRREAETMSREAMRRDPASTLARAEEIIRLREKTYAMGRQYEQRLGEVVTANRRQEREAAARKTEKLERLLDRAGPYEAIGRAGGRVRYDANRHALAPGERAPKTGEWVTVVRPGYEVRGGLSRPPRPASDGTYQTWDYRANKWVTRQGPMPENPQVAGPARGGSLVGKARKVAARATVTRKP